MNTGGETVSRLASWLTSSAIRSARRSVGTGPGCEDIGTGGKPSGFPNFSLLPVAPSSDSRPPIAPRKRARTRTMFAKKIKLLPDSSSEIMKGAQGPSRGDLLKVAKRLEMALDHGTGSGVEMQFGATGPFNRVPEEEVGKSLPHMVVKWCPNCVFHRGARKMVVEKKSSPIGVRCWRATKTEMENFFHVS